MFSKRLLVVAGALVVISLLFAACQPETIEVVKTVIVTEEVMVEGTPVVQEVVKEVIVTATPAPRRPNLIPMPLKRAGRAKCSAPPCFPT